MKNVLRRDGSGRKACGRGKAHLQVERLDDHTVPSTLTVTNLADSGVGSLRQAILDANSPAYPGADVINFNVTGFITLASTLPDLSTDIDIEGPGAKLLTVRMGQKNSHSYDVFTVASGATVTLSGLTVTDGLYAINNGGTLTVTNSTISGNGDQFGEKFYVFSGGIANSGTLTLYSSTVDSNTRCGIRNDGKCTLNSSTVSGNKGGGIANQGTLTVTNSTISINSQRYHSLTGFYGPGVINGGTATIVSSTISGNSGGGVENSGTLHLRNTIIAGNTAPPYTSDNKGGKQVPSDLSGTIDYSGQWEQWGHNLIGNKSGGSGFASTDLLNVDPKLGPLQNNGGPTFTCALMPGSPAIDAGDNTDAPLYDQRGLNRIVDGNGDGTATIDIGAYELQNASKASTKTTLTSSVNPSVSGKSVSLTPMEIAAIPDVGTPTGTVTPRDESTITGRRQVRLQPQSGSHNPIAAIRPRLDHRDLPRGTAIGKASTSATLTQTVNA